MQILVSAVLAFIAVISYAATPAVLFASEKLIAVTEVWPPFRIEDNTKKYGYAGIDIDILEGLAKHLDIEIEIIRSPYARALKQIENGEADIITGVAFTEERSTFIDYVFPSYYDVKPVFYTRIGHSHLVKDYKDLKNYEIGYSLHSAYFEPFDSDITIRKVGVSTEKQLLKMVASGRVDIIIGTNPNIQYDIVKHGLKGRLEQVDYTPQKSTPIFIGLSKKLKNQVLKMKIEKYISEIVADGELLSIIERYK